MATCPDPEGGIVGLSHPGTHCQPLRQQQLGMPEVQEVELGLFGIMCFWPPLSLEMNLWDSVLMEKSCL